MSKSSNFDPGAPSGRIAFDERGTAHWEWRTASGNFKADIDTETVRALQESTDATLGGTPTPAAMLPSGDPYRSADAPRGGAKAPRRTLDDMRKLSEEIKRARAQSKSS